MEIFCQDTKLNLSPYYLKPGFAFGGSCLPKDVRALLVQGEDAGRRSCRSSAPILPRNQLQIERGVQAVIDKGNAQGRHPRLLLQGRHRRPAREPDRRADRAPASARATTCGLRHEREPRRLHGANRDYILNHIPHISRLMVASIDEVLAHAQTIVIGNAAPEFRDVPQRIGEGQTVIDFVRVSDSRTIAGVYEGICW